MTSPTTPPTPVLARAAQPRGKNIMAVASGKGGVGKTWFAITLTHALARRGQRALLFDGDLGLANVDIQLGRLPKHDLGSVIAGRLTLNQAMMRYEAGGFDVVAGRSGSGTLANIPLSRLQTLTEDLRITADGYDKTVLDWRGGGKVDPQSGPLRRNLLVVTTDEPTALTDAYASSRFRRRRRRGWISASSSTRRIRPARANAPTTPCTRPVRVS
jgi:flagellar biosynthesis protein FlhG